MRLSRTLLPASEWQVAAHEPVWTEIRPIWDNRYDFLNLTRAIRAMEGGRGYWMGAPARTFGGGIAYSSLWSSVSVLGTRIIAHELGHNLSLPHAPCGNPQGVDPEFPYPGGRTGARGYGFATGELASPDRPDVISYCRTNPWISDYFFGNALRHRVQAEASASTRTLLLWGGESESGGLYLDPAFVVEAVPVLPDSTGGYTLTGRDADGSVLFLMPFAMPEIADAGEAEGGFVYTLPVQSGWEALASVTLSAPDGRTATLDGSTDRPVTILRNPARDGYGHSSTGSIRLSRPMWAVGIRRPRWAPWRSRAWESQMLRRGVDEPLFAPLPF